MIKMREVLVRPGIVDSARVCALPLATQLFFRNVMHCCDGKGRFPADAAELRAALYWRCPGVSISHVEAWLQKCSEARLVKIYTKDGNRYGEVENFGQRDSSRKAHYPSPDGQEELELGTADPPRRAPSLNRIEGKGIEEKEGEEGGARGGDRGMAWTPAGWTGIAAADRERWQLAYPACDIARQLAQMDLWLRANPERAHKRAWLRFVTNWLKREQDRGGDLRGATNAVPRPANGGRHGPGAVPWQRKTAEIDHTTGF